MEDKIIKEIKIWFERADADLKMSILAIENSLFPESVYHSQQASEKSLKAVLIVFGEEVYEHKITSLFNEKVNLKFNFDFEKIIRDSFELERHYISSKYPIKRRDKKIVDPKKLYSKFKANLLFKKSQNINIKLKKFLKQEFNILI